MPPVAYIGGVRGSPHRPNVFIGTALLRIYLINVKPNIITRDKTKIKIAGDAINKSSCSLNLYEIIGITR